MRPKVQSTQQIETPQPVNKKLQQFLTEINDLCEKYQYQLVPSLRYNSNGITPILNVNEVIPQKKKLTEKK